MRQNAGNQHSEQSKARTMAPESLAGALEARGGTANRIPLYITDLVQVCQMRIFSTHAHLRAHTHPPFVAAPQVLAPYGITESSEPAKDRHRCARIAAGTKTDPGELTFRSARSAPSSLDGTPFDA
jgi:hypothetical protein